ncbi:MAG: hypothetical protein GXO87_02950 [Chlorobi bacterium]|nr:hypothetical protein [Chlorobiota bacterium]
MKTIKILLSVLCIASAISAQNKWSFDQNAVPLKPIKEFQFLAYFISQGITNNIYAKNDLLKGQTVGRLFGANTTNTGQSTLYFEQRLIPFIIYQPALLNGKAILRMSFEIDWTWGDASYGAGGNFGGGFNADQVNIQTQNIELELLPFKNFTINIGMQRLFDTPYNPYRTFFSTMLQTGYRLAYWGSDAVGISVRYDLDFHRFKAGYYQLWENNINQNDDVTLWEAVYEMNITKDWTQGISAWYLYDRANGEGGVSILGQGLNSNLTDYNGVFRFPFGANPYRADIFWVGTFGNYNPEFLLGRYSLNMFFVSNLGSVQTAIAGEYKNAVDLFGFSGNLRAGYKYGQTPHDAVIIDVTYASGDENGIDDGKYTGVLTSNYYGSPGNAFIGTGSYLLYPHGNVVNRFYAAISDLGNIGYGQIGGTINFWKSLTPNKLDVKIGAAYARSIYNPEGGGNSVGAEINGMISFKPAVFMNIELHAAFMWLGDFYDSPLVNSGVTVRPVNPYTFFVVFKWLLF